MAKDAGCFAYQECSTKNNEGIREVWETALRGITEVRASSIPAKEEKRGSRLFGAR